MNSVLTTFRETLLLWQRNFWFLLAICIATGVPKIACEKLQLSLDLTHGHSNASLYYLLIGFIALIFYCVCVAAILALLSSPAPEKPWPFIWSKIKQCTWTLVWLCIRLVIIAIGVAIPVVIVLRLFKPSPFLSPIILVIVVVLIKYALGYPLVVVEGLNSSQALRRSWDMTRGHFSYVFGCYVLLWLFEWSVNHLSNAVSRGVSDPTLGIYFLKSFVAFLVSTLWTILSWCMYLHIKSADAPSPSSRKPGRANEENLNSRRAPL